MSHTPNKRSRQDRSPEAEYPSNGSQISSNSLEEVLILRKPPKLLFIQLLLLVKFLILLSSNNLFRRHVMNNLLFLSGISLKISDLFHLVPQLFAVDQPV